jgi:TRPM family ion channel
MMLGSRPFVSAVGSLVLLAIAGPRATEQATTVPITLNISSVAPDRNDALSRLVTTVREEAQAFVFLSGGASNMSDEHQRQLFAMFAALGQIAKGGLRVAVGDGGTQAGIMRAAGDARQASGNAFLLIGVAPAKEIPPRGKTPIDPHHSHIVSVDNPSVPKDSDAWGSETETMYWLFDRLAAGRPSVTVVANGGGIVLHEVAANVNAGRTMIVIEGSGRAADALASLVKKTEPAADVTELRATAAKADLARRPDLYRFVPLSAGAAGLRAALTKALTK